MKLITKKVAKSLPALNATEQTPNEQKIVKAKLFCHWNNWAWYLLEYDPNEHRAFALVVGYEAEFGYVPIDELEKIKGPGGLGIEREIHFEPITLGELNEKQKLGLKL